MEFKLGRRRPPPFKRKMHMRSYMPLAAMPQPPVTCAYSTRALSSLRQVYENDTLGDCVVAGMAHLEGIFTGNAGQPVDLFTRAQILNLYGAIGGYIPGREDTDNGCDERTALAYWQQTGAGSATNRISGWLSVDALNPAEVRMALYLFENLFFGVELPDKWVDPFPSKPGFVWDAGVGPANPDNGHCFVGVGYDPIGVVISTWGMVGKITDAAIAQYASTAGSGELYTVLSPQIINKALAKAPNGLAWDDLERDFRSLGGTL